MSDLGFHCPFTGLSVLTSFFGTHTKSESTCLFPTPGCSHLSLLWLRLHFPRRSHITQTWASLVSVRNTEHTHILFHFCQICSDCPYRGAYISTQAAMIEFVPLYQTLLVHGIDLTFGKQSAVLPQTALASWLARLSPGSRNRDETCRRSLWCCSQSGESLHQTLTRWSTEPTHIKQEKKCCWHHLCMNRK